MTRTPPRPQDEADRLILAYLNDPQRREYERLLIAATFEMET